MLAVAVFPERSNVLGFSNTLFDIIKVVSIYPHYIGGNSIEALWEIWFEIDSDYRENAKFYAKKFNGELK